MSQEKENQKIAKRKKPDMSPLLYGKLPPQAPDLEGAVLGAAMLEPQAMDLLLEVIQEPETFYSDANQRIYSCLIEMFNKGARIDFMTVCEELRKRNELEMVGGSYYVTSLTRDVVSSAHIDEHARIIVQKYTAREIIRFSGEMISNAYEDSTDVFDMVDEVGEFASAITEKVVKKQYVHISKGMSRFLASTAALMERDNKLVGVPSGFRELDIVTGGWQKTDLIILAARPAVGKTAFILNLVMNAAMNRDNPTAVGLFSLEMSEDQLIQRMMSNVADVELESIKRGTCSKEEFERLVNASTKVREMPIYIDDHASLGIMELRAKARKMKRVHGVGLIIIDYLQLMKGDGKSGGNREQEISKISRDLKVLAKELEVPIIALSQMSRLVEGRADNVPKLSDLRDSGAIEQDADLVLFLYANSKDTLKKQPWKVKERHASLAKHRNGKLADLIYDFDGAHQRFHNEELTVLDISHEDITERSGDDKYSFEKFSTPPVQISVPAHLAPESTQGIQDELPF